MRWRSWGLGSISRLLGVENREGGRGGDFTQGWWGPDAYGRIKGALFLLAEAAMDQGAFIMGDDLTDQLSNRSLAEFYATATVARLQEAANRVAFTADRTTLLRVVNG